MLVGKDPRNINLLIKTLYAQYNLTHLHIHLASWAFSGIELALWDIAGQSANMPLYQLWGGAFRKKIEMQASVDREELDVMTEVCANMVKDGYKTLYTKIGWIRRTTWRRWLPCAKGRGTRR